MRYPAVVLLLVFWLVPVSEVSPDEPAKKIGVYSCDNPEMTDKPCRSWPDPEYMIIRFHKEPNGVEIVRVEDQGVGFCADLLSTSTASDGEKWLLLSTKNGLRGFVRESSIIHFAGCGLPPEYRMPVVVSPDARKKK